MNAITAVLLPLSPVAGEPDTAETFGADVVVPSPKFSWRTTAILLTDAVVAEVVDSVVVSAAVSETEAVTSAFAATSATSTGGTSVRFSDEALIRISSPASAAAERRRFL